MASLTVLDREVYSELEAARLLRVAPSTLHYWLEGEGGRGKAHQPVIRLERRGRGATVTWAEFIEASLLREYRVDKGVPMAKMRAFITYLRDGFGVPYPLAQHRPYIDKGKGRGLLYDAQESAGLGGEFALVAMAGGQYVLTPPSQSFLDRVEWDDDLPRTYRPADDPSSLVRCSPTLRFGKPAVGGISTHAIWEQHQAGFGEDEIVDMYDLTDDDVFYAIAYERTLAHEAA